MRKLTSRMGSILKLSLCILMVINSQVHAYSPKAPVLEDDLDARSTLVRERLLIEYAEIKSASQFIEKFAPQRPAAEKVELLKRLSKLKRLPKLEAIANGLRLTQDSMSFDMDLQSISKRRFLINGQVFTFSPNHSWVIQSEILWDKLQHPRKSSYSLFSLLIPEAHGVVMQTIMAFGYTVILMGLVNTAIGHYGNDGFNVLDWEVCERVRKSNNGEFPRNPRFCKDYRREVEEQAKKMPGANAVQVALTDAGSKSEKYSTSNETCPDQNKDQHYNGTVTIVSKEEPTQRNKDVKNEVVKSNEGLKLVRVYAEVDGTRLKSASVYHDDLVKGESKSKLLATYVVDGNSVLEEIVIPASSKINSKLSKEKLTTRISASADLKDKPDLQAQQAFFQGLFSNLGDRLKFCKMQKENKEAKEAVKKVEKGPRESAGTPTGGNTGHW
ncbi:MAG TPA: hypothetical protein VIG33_04865 [Pseudobdellovibrionaceae bacterium]